MPYLDRNVVQFAHRLPSEYKVRETQMKRVLAYLAQELPPDVATGTKQGLHTPPAFFQNDAARRFHIEAILDTSLATGLFDHQRLESLIGKKKAGSYSFAFQLWPLCHFCLWWNHFIDGGESRFRVQDASADRIQLQI